MKHLKAGKRVTMALTIALALMITFFANAIALMMSNRHNLSLDVTRNAAHRLGDQSLQLLAGLQQEVTIQVLAPKDSFEGNPYLIQARNILDQYPRLSPRVDLRYIDYARDPAFAAKFPDLSLAPGNILVSSGNNTRQLGLNELFNYAPAAQGGAGSAVVSSRAQEAVSSAILQVTSGRALQAALLTGADTDSAPAFLSLLRDNNYHTSQVNLTSPDFSAHDLCLLLAPKVDLSPATLQKLDDFLYNDGAYQKILVYAMDAGQPQLPNLAAFLKEWGVEVLDGAVFETNASRTFQMQPFYPLAEHSDESMAAKLRDASIPLLLPRAKPFRLLFEAKDFQRASSLLHFSETSGVRPSQAGSDFDPKAASLKGPLPAMALLTRQGKGQQAETARSYLLLLSSSAMLETSTLNNTQLANAEYLLKLLGELSGEEKVMALQPVSLAASRLSINSATIRLLGILLMWVVPGLLLLAGLLVFLYRRFQ